MLLTWVWDPMISIISWRRASRVEQVLTCIRFKCSVTADGVESFVFAWDAGSTFVDLLSGSLGVLSGV